MTDTKKLIETPYGRKTPELLCAAMDAYEEEPKLLAALLVAEEFIARHTEDWYASGQRDLMTIRTAIEHIKDRRRV